MSYHINFGDFRVLTDQLKSIQETIDIEGTPCVMLHYSEGACILLYDEAASEAVDWFEKNAADAIQQPWSVNNMPRNLNVYADRPRIHGDAKTSPKQTQSGPTKEQRENALRETVLENIGRPDDLHRVEIKQLQDTSHYRVNVYRLFKNIPRFTDSYYLVITPDGVMSSPGMEKKYHDADLDTLWNSLTEIQKTNAKKGVKF